MKSIPGAKITFTKQTLRRFDDGQRKVLYIFAHILNRTKLLAAHVFSHWQSALNAPPLTPESDADLFGVLEFLILLAGDLKEGWEAVQSCYYATQVSKTLNSKLPEDIQQRLRRLGDHFTGDSMVHRLRNDFAYHHSPEKAFSTAAILQEDDPHVAYLFEDENNYFDFATKLRIAAIAEELSLPNWNATIEVLVDEVVKKAYTDFSQVLNAVLATLIQDVAVQHEAAELPAVPSATELSTHYFFYVEPPGLDGKCERAEPDTFLFYTTATTPA